jgi:hypothetical protein
MAGEDEIMVDIPGDITSTATFEGGPDFMTFSGQFETATPTGSG